MRKQSYLGLIIISGLLLLSSMVAFRRYLPYAGGAMVNRQPAIVLQMRNAHFVGINRGAKIWSLDAKTVEIGQNRHITTLDGIKNGKIFDAGKMALKVEAGRAIYNSAGGNLTLDKGIRLNDADDQQVTAQGAHWNSITSTLHSKGRVLYHSSWGKASSDRLQVDMKNKEMTMWNVVISIKPDKLEAAENAL